MAIRQAIITYDTDWVDAWGSSAQDLNMNHIFYQALRAEPYPRERGIKSIRHIPDGNEIIIAPTERDDILMSYSPCITLPLDLVEKLVEIAAKNAGRGGQDRTLLDRVREEIAGTRKRFNDIEIVAVPRMKLGSPGG